MRRQERDEVSRRFVDEGFDRLGRELADAYTEAQSRFTLVGQMLVAAEDGDFSGIDDMLVLLQKARVPGVSYEAHP